MNQAVVYAYLRQNKDKLNDLLGHLTTDLLNLGGIPIHASLIGTQKNWRLLADNDAEHRAKAVQHHIDYMQLYDKDKTGTQAYLSYGDDLPKTFTHTFKPLLELWADHAENLHLEKLNAYEQLVKIDDYVSQLNKVETLVYSALQIAVGENISLLRGGEAKVQSKLRHYESKQEELNKLEKAKVPELKKQIQEHVDVIQIYTMELDMLVKKKETLNDFIQCSNKRLQQLYGSDKLYHLTQSAEAVIKIEEDMKVQLEAEIQKLTEQRYHKELQMQDYQKSLESYEKIISSEKINSRTQEQLSYYQRQLDILKACISSYDTNGFLPIARSQLKLMFENPRHIDIKFLQNRVYACQLTNKELDNILIFYAQHFKQNNFYGIGANGWKLTNDVKGLQDAGRYQYEVAKNSLELKDNSDVIYHTLSNGEFHCREINHIIKVDELKSATPFMCALVGAFYVAYFQQIDKLPKEIQDYVKELKTEKYPTLSIEQIYMNAKDGLDQFIQAPDSCSCSKLEQEILISVMKQPTVITSNVRFFVHRPPAAPSDKMEVTENTDQNQARLSVTTQVPSQITPNSHI